MKMIVAIGVLVLGFAFPTTPNLNPLDINPSNHSTREDFFNGWCWAWNPSVIVWKLDQDRQETPSGLTGESFLLFKPIRIEEGKIWVEETDPEFRGRYFFHSDDVTFDPRLTKTWEEIALGQHCPEGDSIWEIVAEAASAESQPELVSKIVDEMCRAGLREKIASSLSFWLSSEERKERAIEIVGDYYAIVAE